MINNNNCENYPQCRNCNKSFECWSKGNINAPNTLLNSEVDKFNNVYQSNNINYASSDLEVNKTVLHLVKWELDCRIKHNAIAMRIRSNIIDGANFTTTKPIDLNIILEWYNNKYSSCITYGELMGFLHKINYNLKELEKWQ